MTRHLLAIDQGTTGTTVLIMDVEGRTLGRATSEFTQHFPEPGWVEHEPEEIWQSVRSALSQAFEAAGVGWDAIAAIGITNQPETTLIWDKRTGQPIHRAIVWQDRRTAARCAELEKEGHGDKVREITGLVIDPYFSGTKIGWLLDNVPGARARAEKGELSFGTVDSYLVFRLTGGALHATDVTNASRTLLMNLRSLAWDDEMCALLGVPRTLLPAIVPSAGAIAKTRAQEGIPEGMPIAGIAGDQQAALFGQACFAEGDVKCTYGTGAFVLIHTGNRPVKSRFGLLRPWVGNRKGRRLRARGSSFIAGAAVQWLRDGLGSSDRRPTSRRWPARSLRARVSSFRRCPTGRPTGTRARGVSSPASRVERARRTSRARRSKPSRTRSKTSSARWPMTSGCP
jgi:glycerol kinase